ncbi:MAG: hypothetical protein OEZ36_04155 [Spirochaetota bacterium]|nr:hypothetical protein [Spirochaetota bacterium]
MALFDIPAANAYRDYPLMRAVDTTRNLPMELLAGKSELNRTLQELSTWPGPNPIFVNKLI